MEKIIQYRAVDGVLFDDEQECQEWEWRVTHEPHSICLRNKDFVPYNPNSIGEMEEAIYAAAYIEVANVRSWDEDLDWLREYWGFGSNGIKHPGTYKYDWDNFEWVEVNQLNLELKER